MTKRFLRLQRPASATATCSPAALVDLGKAEGFFFWVRGERLVFVDFPGSPGRGRAMTIVRRGPIAYALPASVKDHSRDPAYFLVPADDPKKALFDKPNAWNLYLHCDVETLTLEDLGGKFGVVSQDMRVDIHKWWTARCAA